MKDVIVKYWWFPWLLVVLMLIAGCQRKGEATDTPVNRVSASGGASPAPEGPTLYRMRKDLPVIVDSETGCQYLGYTGHGLTPRMSRYENGAQYHLGCYLKDTFVNPVTGNN